MAKTSRCSCLQQSRVVRGDDVSRPKGGGGGGGGAAPALLWMFGILTNYSPFRPNSPLFSVFASMLSQPAELDARAPRLGNAKKEVELGHIFPVTNELYITMFPSPSFSPAFFFCFFFC